MICSICGAEFEPQGSRRIYCTPECSRKAKNTKLPDRRKRNEIRKSMNERQTKNKLNEVLKDCRKNGVDYSEWKKQQALARVPRIEV